VFLEVFDGHAEVILIALVALLASIRLLLADYFANCFGHVGSEDEEVVSGESQEQLGELLVGQDVAALSAGQVGQDLAASDSAFLLLLAVNHLGHLGVNDFLEHPVLRELLLLFVATEVELVGQTGEGFSPAGVNIVVVQVVHKVQAQFDGLFEILCANPPFSLSIRRNLSSRFAQTLGEETLELGVPDLDGVEDEGEEFLVGLEV
jgi:hypothetical protein